MQRIVEFVNYFTIYSFLGWIIESVIRGFEEKRFVNPGFLTGPFLPIYGFGATLVVWLNNEIVFGNSIEKGVVFFLLLTFLEYMAGMLLEMIYNIKLWDYSQKKFNIAGRVCLEFSLAWVALSFAFLHFIHPFVRDFIMRIDTHILEVSSLTMFTYFVIDGIRSSNALNKFKETMVNFRENTGLITGVEIDEVINSTKRLILAFPLLGKQIQKNIMKRFGAIMDSMNKKNAKSEKNEIIMEEEYYEVVKDILNNEEFLKLKNYYHHNSSIYKHVLEVSYLSYKISKALKLNYKVVARGALLHDFFLYDWRDGNVPELKNERLHGFSHPKIALKNARKQFELDDVETDIIINHMWPLTLRPPKYKESYIVLLVDKYLATKEFAISFSGKLKGIWR